MTELAPGSQPIRVFVLDDHQIVRQGVSDLLEAEPDIHVVGEAGTAAAALARIPAARPDVAILDVRLPDGDGVTVCREIRAHMPDIACLMLTGYDDDQAFREAIMAGCAGYILKKVRGGGLAEAVRMVASGQPALDPDATSRLLAWLRDQSRRRELAERLTGHERQILELLGEGLSNREIGERMALAEKTVKNYVTSLLAKLGMRHRTQAAALAARISAGQRCDLPGSRGSGE
jgi:DNA-binding NarL/FixJ family response regulator